VPTLTIPLHAHTTAQPGASAEIPPWGLLPAAYIELLGASFPLLQRLVTKGAVEDVGPGLYRLATANPDELKTIAICASAIPTGIVCVLSVLRINKIETQVAHEGWLALDRKARKPTRPFTDVWRPGGPWEAAS
jgi:hypothetical protein